MSRDYSEKKYSVHLFFKRGGGGQNGSIEILYSRVKEKLFFKTTIFSYQKQEQFPCPSVCILGTHNSHIHYILSRLSEPLFSSTFFRAKWCRWYYRYHCLLDHGLGKFCPQLHRRGCFLEISNICIWFLIKILIMKTIYEFFSVFIYEYSAYSAILMSINSLDFHHYVNYIVTCDILLHIKYCFISQASKICVCLEISYEKMNMEE